MPDTPSNDARLELCDLAERYMQRDLDAAGVARLNRLLKSDPALRAEFVALCTDAQLLTQTLAQRDHESAFGACLSKLAEDRPASPARAVVVSRRIRIPVALTLAAALLLAAAAVAVYLLTSPPLPVFVAPDDEPIATLIESDGTVIIDDSVANPGGDYAAGTVTVETGSADFLLTSRVGIRLHSATTLTLHSDMAARLTRGSAEFHCPSGATGYTVHLPSGARVVDLGTRFRVSIEPDGSYRAAVSEGRVDVHRGDRADRIVAGQVAVLSPDGTLAVLDSGDGEAWLAAFDIDSSREPAATQKYFEPVDGRGLTGGATRHGVTLRYDVVGPIKQTPARDRGAAGRIAAGPLPAVLRDFVFADTLSDGHLVVKLDGLEPDTAYRLRWFHYHNSSNTSEFDRIAIYRDSPDPANRIVESSPYGTDTDPQATGHSDFVVTTDRHGSIRLVTGPHSGGRSIQMLNGLAVLGRAPIEEQNESPDEKSENQETTHEP